MAIYFACVNFFFFICFFLLWTKLSQYLLDRFSRSFHQMEGICVNFIDPVFFRFLKGRYNGNQFCVKITYPPPCTYRSDIQKRNGITPCICMISLNSATNATVIDIQQTLHLSELCELTLTYWGRNFCWRIFTTFNRGLRHLKKRKSEKKLKYILNTAIVNTLVWMFGVTMVILQTEFKQALQTAQTKVVIVDFFANWCTPCRLLAPKLKVCIFSVHLCSLHFPIAYFLIMKCHLFLYVF